MIKAGNLVRIRAKWIKPLLLPGRILYLNGIKDHWEHTIYRLDSCYPDALLLEPVSGSDGLSRYIRFSWSTPTAEVEDILELVENTTTSESHTTRDLSHAVEINQSRITEWLRDGMLYLDQHRADHLYTISSGNKTVVFHREEDGTITAEVCQRLQELTLLEKSPPTIEEKKSDIEDRLEGLLD